MDWISKTRGLWSWTFFLTFSLYSLRWSFLPQWNVFVVFFSSLTVIVIESTFMTIDHATFSQFFQSFRLETLCKPHKLLFLAILVGNFWRILLTSASMKNYDRRSWRILIRKYHLYPPFCQRSWRQQNKWMNFKAPLIKILGSDGYSRLWNKRSPWNNQSPP